VGEIGEGAFDRKGQGRGQEMRGGVGETGANEEETEVWVPGGRCEEVKWLSLEMKVSYLLT